MKHKTLSILMGIIFLSLSWTTAQAQLPKTITAVKTGAWNQTATWGGTLPEIASEVIIPAGMTITIPQGYSVTNTGNVDGKGLSISGSLVVSGTLAANRLDTNVEGTFTNNGSVQLLRFFFNDGITINKGSITSSASTYDYSTFTNESGAVFDNRGIFTANSNKTFINRGIITNNAQFDFYSTAENYGTITNAAGRTMGIYRRFYNKLGATVTNFGAFKIHGCCSTYNDGTIDNQGTYFQNDGGIENSCTGVVTGTPVTGYAPETICNLNAAPVVSSDNGTITVNEGATANNTGKWSDENAGDTVTLSSSIGTVIKNGTNAGGTWSWSFAPTDNAPTQTVTITAGDGAASSQTTFNLTVNNVAPTAVFNAPGAVDLGNTFSISLANPFDSSATDVAAGFTYAFDCGGGYAAFNSSSSALCSASTGGARTVKGKIRDKDGGETEYTASISVRGAAAISNVAGSGTFGGNATLTAKLTSGSTNLSGKTVTFTYNSGSTVTTVGTGITDSSGVATAALNLNGINAGTYAPAIGASFAGDGSYVGASGNGALTVNKASQTITFAPLANKTVVDADFNVSAAATSNLSVSFAAAGNCSINGNSVHITGAGTCEITASQTGNNNYNAAAPISRSFVIEKASQTITFNGVPSSAVFGNSFVVSASASSGLAVSINASGGCTIAGTTVTMTSGTNACQLTASQAGDGSYKAAAETKTTNAQKASATISLSNLNQNYSGAARTVTATINPAGLTGVSITYNGLAAAPTAAGNYAVVVSLTNDNYQAANATGTLVVNKAQLIITAEDKTKTYGASNPSFTVTFNGFINGETSSVLGGSLNFSTTATNGSPVGTYSIIPSGLNSLNYDITFVNGKLTVTKAVLTVSAGNLEKQYSDPLPTLVYQITGLVNGDRQSAVSGAPLVTSTANQFSEPGVYPITLALGTLSAANYDFFLDNDTATGGDLTVTEENAAATYSGPTYFATASPTSNTAKLTLSATLVDYDDGIGNRGDIRNAVVEFRKDNPNGMLLGTGNVGLINSGGTTVGTATAEYTYILNNSEMSNSGTSFDVYAVVKGWYSETPVQFETVTVSLPGADNVSGGGSLIMQDSNGIYAGRSGSKMNFGFSMKYNKSGKNLRGQAKIIIRGDDGRIYEVKSNAVNSVAVSGNNYPKTGTLTAKANMTDITDPLNPFSLGGNLTLQIDMKDTGSGGQNDEIAVTVWDSNGGMYFASRWSGTKTVLQLLNGGNVSVK